MEIEVLALFVSVLALLTVPDLNIAWRRLKVIIIAAVVLTVLLLIASLLQAFVLQFTSRYLYLPDGVLWPFLASMGVLGIAAELFHRYQRRHRTKEPETPEPETPEEGYDPGEYKTGGM